MYVYLDEAEPVVTEADPVPDKYTARLEDEVEFLRDQVRRQQEIIGQQAISLRALSAPESTLAKPEPAKEEEPSTEAESPVNQSSSWWAWLRRR